MKIGIVCYPTYGGSGVMATELGKGLAQNGHEVHFISYRQPARLSGFLENVFYHETITNDYPLFEHTPYESALVSSIINVVKYQNLDLLHVHYAVPHASVAYMVKQILKEKGINLPFITTLHGTDITLVGVDEAFAPVVEFTINNSDGVTVVSESLKEDTVKLFDIKKEIKTIYNFVDLQRFKKSNKDHFKKAIAPNGEKILVHVSNFRKVKRTQDVFEIYCKVIEEVPAKLILVGDGPERNSIQNLCKEKSLCDDVLFLGKQEAIEEILAVADLFIMPSEKESFGLAALEAMACGVPVISSNAGGIPEVNIDGKTGFISNIGDTEEMGKNALKLLRDEKLYATFSEHALNQAKRFDLKSILKQYEDFYVEVIAKSNL